MLCLRYTLPVFTKRLEPIKIPRKTSAIVVCGAKGPRPRYPRVWKSRNRIGTISKSAKLVECVKGLSNVKEEVYGALDSFIAWELEFPLITVKKALKTLENEREWKRIIQVTKWMLSKGQGKTMGSYFTLLNALAEDGRLDEAEELWTKLFSENLESMPRVFYDKMISIYYHRDMHEKMFEIFADMEELGVKPNTSIVNMVGNVFKKLEMLDKYEKLMNKYPPPEWEYRYIKGKRVRIRAKHLNEFNAVDDVVNEVDGETSQSPDEVYGETNKNSKEAGDETSQNSDEVDDETSRNPNELYEEVKASSNELSIGIENSS